jgi:hypothetical protein
MSAKVRQVEKAVRFNVEISQTQAEKLCALLSVVADYGDEGLCDVYNELSSALSEIEVWDTDFEDFFTAKDSDVDIDDVDDEEIGSLEIFVKEKK